MFITVLSRKHKFFTLDKNLLHFGCVFITCSTYYITKLFVYYCRVLFFELWFVKQFFDQESPPGPREKRRHGATRQVRYNLLRAMGPQSSATPGPTGCRCTLSPVRSASASLRPAAHGRRCTLSRRRRSKAVAGRRPGCAALWEHLSCRYAISGAWGRDTVPTGALYRDDAQFLAASHRGP